MNRYINCCKINNNTKKCIRNDNKIFTLPRKFSYKKCINNPIRGFTMKASCAPYKYCKKKKILAELERKQKKNNFYIIQIILKNLLMYILIKIQLILYILNIQL